MKYPDVWKNKLITDKDGKQSVKELYNPVLISRIQPQGNLKLDDNQGANFLCDIRKVSLNQSLKPQASLYYSLQSVDNEISAGKRQIAALKEKANEANADISQLNFDISALKSNQKYQTPEEIEQSNAAIQNKNSQINNLKNDIVQYQSGIRNGRQKLKKLQQKWNDIKSGKFKNASTKSAAAPSSEASYSSLPSTAESSSEAVMAD
jgi:chromosome segregation ATPase